MENVCCRRRENKGGTMLAEIIYVGTHEKAPEPPASWRRRLKSITGYFYSFLSEYFEDTSSPFRGSILSSFIPFVQFAKRNSTDYQLRAKSEYGVTIRSFERLMDGKPRYVLCPWKFLTGVESRNQDLFDMLRNAGLRLHVTAP